jgi:phospholipid-binding lipoprotein MlaA
MPALMLVSSMLVAMSGCNSLPVDDYAVFDPHEKGNRVSYRVSDAVDEAVIAPVARGYRYVTPDWLERGIGNFFTNLRTLPSALNGFLQGKPARGGTDFARLVINSTVGVAGFFDVARSWGLEFQDEDFGQTLAVWGVKKSRYIYVPFLGPSTLRDLPTTLIRGSIPRLIIGSDYPWALSGLDLIQVRASVLGATDARQASALDPYAFTRDAYFQRRKYLIYDGAPPLDELFEEFDEFEDDD